MWNVVLFKFWPVLPKAFIRLRMHKLTRHVCMRTLSMSYIVELIRHVCTWTLSVLYCTAYQACLYYNFFYVLSCTAYQACLSGHNHYHMCTGSSCLNQWLNQFLDFVRNKNNNFCQIFQQAWCDFIAKQQYFDVFYEWSQYRVTSAMDMHGKTHAICECVGDITPVVCKLCHLWIYVMWESCCLRICMTRP